MKLIVAETKQKAEQLKEAFNLDNKWKAVSYGTALTGYQIEKAVLFDLDRTLSFVEVKQRQDWVNVQLRCRFPTENPNIIIIN